ncbi:MAG TPA: hypothetical protein VFA20_33230 [Myxococcaceae bacterium]|nr:hypothetical protein [Myxococcaceae bacterium]
MRLARVEHGHAFKEKLILWLLGVIAGARAPGVLRTILYRPSFWGKRQAPINQRVMRGPSEWSVGEREIFAAFVSRLNQCPF